MNFTCGYLITCQKPHHVLTNVKKLDMDAKMFDKMIENANSPLQMRLALLLFQLLKFKIT